MVSGSAFRAPASDVSGSGDLGYGLGFRVLGLG